MRDYINTSIEKIRQAMDNNKLVIFVGAGVSANSKCPSWSELIERFADELGIPQIERNTSIEYFLKIPQYYFIERGEKEYFDIINDVFNNPNNIPTPNSINKILFELNPSTIITTNFDELIEKTLELEGRYYTVISQDKDLPYSLNENLVIKMHGDVKLKNIVLKEEDYLNYSSNFPLIQNYIKGLFSTKTILFVGYSANDPDFKLIFNWVKEQLKGHFQPAYLLETVKEKESLEFNYYKDRGINILYYNQIENDITRLLGVDTDKTLTDDRGKYLYKFLLYIKEYSIESSFIDDIYNRLKIFEGLNAIMPEYIKKQLFEKYNCFSIRYNVLYIDKERCEYLSVIQENINNCLKVKNNKTYQETLKEIIDKDKKIQFIFNILHRATIEMIKIDGADNIKEILIEDYVNVNNDSEIDSYNNLLRKFNFKELEKKLIYYLSDVPFENSEYLYIRKAYFLYKIGKYLDAYIILKKISVHCYSSKKYLLWYISIFNMKYLRGKIFLEKQILGQGFELNYEKSLNEIDKIDLEEEVRKLPRAIQNKIKYISKIISIDLFNEKIQEIQEIISEIKKDKKLLESGGDSYNENVYMLYSKIRALNNFIQENYFTIAHLKNISRIFSTFNEGIIVNHSVKEKSHNFFGESPKVDILGYFDIEMMMKYSTNKELKGYIKDNGIEELNIDIEGLEYLLTVFENITNLSDENIFEFRFIIDNMLTILSYSNISKEQFSRIIKLCVVLLKMNLLREENFENLNTFIVKIYKKDKDTVELNSIILFLKEYINLYNDGKLYSLVQEVLKRSILFLNICYICNERDTMIDCKDSIKIFIEDYIDKIKDETYKNQRDIEEIIPNLIIPLLSVTEDNSTKNYISNSIKEIILHFRKVKNGKVYLKLEYYALLYDVFEIIDEEKKQFAIEINRYFLERSSCEKRSGFESYDFSKNYEKMLMQLILNKKIDYNLIKDLCCDIRNQNSMFSFFIEPDIFDYSKFDSEWIIEVSDDTIIELSKKRERVDKIIPTLLKKLDKENINKELKRKILLIIKETFQNKE
jgi:hypothetical protein